MTPQQVLIYTLADPRTGEVRYVGKTIKSLSDRLRIHLAAVRRHEHRYVCRWIASLLAINLRPDIKVVEIVENADEWIAREMFWIERFRQDGAKLTNLTIGGEGWHGRKHTDESRAKIGAAHRGKQISEATRKKISAANSGRVISDEHKAKLSAAMLGRIFSEETRAKISASKRGKPLHAMAGKANHKAKLNDDAVRLIRSGALSCKDAMAKFGISDYPFYRIKSGKSWKLVQ